MKAVRTLTYVARQTGLSPHVIRIWEKRYGAVRPERAANNRRLYSEEDVERLRLLREATLAGHGIGQIATASLAELKRLVDEAGAAPGLRLEQRVREKDQLVVELLGRAVNLVTAMDARAFDRLLDHAAVELGSPAVLQKFLAPLAEKVGDLWRQGDLSVAHEHFMTAHLTEFLSAFARPYAEGMNAPHLVLATPSGQLHGLGAIIVAAAARSHGWRTTYLGAALPIEELAGALRHLQPRAVGLSIVYPPDDADLRRDLKKLRRLLPESCAILLGGRSAKAYETTARQIDAMVVESLDKLFPVLDALQLPDSRRGN